jgi:hypothetical protein
MLRIFALAIAVFMTVGSAMASTLTCHVPLYSDNEWSHVTRFLEADGTFSFQNYWSAAAPGFYPTFHIASPPISDTREQMLQFQILEGVPKKLNKGSIIEITDGKGNRLEARRKYEERWSRNYELQLDRLFKQFGRTGSAELKLVNGPHGKKAPFSGKLDLALLAKEATLMPDAERRLDAMQADFRNQCKPLIEPDASEDSANWSCVSTAKDKLGEHFADSDSIGSFLRLGITAEIRWYSNSTTGSLNWFKSKVARNLASIRFQSGSFQRETKHRLPHTDYDFSFDVPFSLSEAILLKDDLLIQALDFQGNILDQATLPLATLVHVAEQLETLKAKSILDRKDYKHRCEPPQEIIVT